jgi:hypothetical protein
LTVSSNGILFCQKPKPLPLLEEFHACTADGKSEISADGLHFIFKNAPRLIHLRLDSKPGDHQLQPQAFHGIQSTGLTQLVLLVEEMPRATWQALVQVLPTLTQLRLFDVSNKTRINQADAKHDFNLLDLGSAIRCCSRLINFHWEILPIQPDSMRCILSSLTRLQTFSTCLDPCSMSLDDCLGALDLPELQECDFYLSTFSKTNRSNSSWLKFISWNELLDDSILDKPDLKDVKRRCPNIQLLSVHMVPVNGFGFVVPPELISDGVTLLKTTTLCFRVSFVLIQLLWRSLTICIALREG